MAKPTKTTQEDKIDLSSINKTSNKSIKLPTLKNPFKKQKGPLRDDEGKFAATTGGGGLKSLKKFNWKRAAPFIAIIALVGGVMVFQSFAATSSVRVSGNRENVGFIQRLRLALRGAQSRDQNTDAGSQGGYTSCKDWANKNGVSMDYVGSKENTGSDWIRKIYMQLFDVYPTEPPAANNEVFHWIDRAEQLHKEYANDEWKQRCGVRWAVFQEIQATTPQGRERRVTDQKTKGDEVLKTIYADQLPHLTGKRYVRSVIHTGSGLPVIPTQPSFAATNAMRWESNWPDKVKVCAIVYNPGGRPKSAGYKTTVRLSTQSVIRTQVLEELPNIQRSGAWPKYEVCTQTIPRTYETKVAGMTDTLKHTNDFITAGITMVSVTYKDPGRTDGFARTLKTFKWDTNPNDYSVVLEQYQIKKAE